MRIDVAALTGENAVRAGDGQVLYERLHDALAAGDHVYLDFAGVHVFASGFLNVAFGQLFRDFTPKTLNQLLHMDNLAPHAAVSLRVVIDSARQFYGIPGKSAELGRDAYQGTEKRPQRMHWGRRSAQG